jgi:hypothetical protein
MRKIYIFLLISLAIGKNVDAQWSVDFRYQYFQNNHVNRAVEMFNLSNSFLDKGIQYAHHGYGIGFNKYYKISTPRGIFVRVEIPYQRLDQWSKWGNVDRWTTTQEVGVNGHLVFNPKAIKGKMNTGPMGPRFYFLVGAGYHIWQSHVKVNQELSYSSTWKGYTSFSIGMGHRMILLGPRIVVSPYITLQATPSWNSADMEKSISGTYWYRIDEKNVAWQTNVGIECTVLKKEKKRRGILKNLLHRKVKSATDI